MDHNYHLGWTDYTVIGLTLLISTVIGLKFQFFGNRQRTTTEYLMAGKNMSVFPVVMSIAVTIISATTILGTPIEVYRFGAIFSYLVIASTIGMVSVAIIFTPVYFNCNVSTTYEFLELRFGKATRYTASVLFLLQMIFLTAVVLYGPVLALSAVTDLSIEASIVIVGLICSFYSCAGGLKGVLWTDVFQSCMMVISLIVMYIVGISEAGGISNIYKASMESQRLNFINFSVDFTERYTTLNLIARGFIASLSYYGISQVEVQRLFSLSSVKRAQRALLLSVIPFSILWLMCVMLGLIIFTIFKDCDPILDGAHTRISKYDQVLPYYIVTRLHSVPGLTGLCIAGIFSGSLSTISSALNSLSTVAVLDLIQPFCKKNLTNTRAVYIAKALSMLFGVLCICLAFAISKVDSIIAINHALSSLTEGPLLAVFLVGILTRKGSQRCVLFGLVTGFAFTCWIGFGIVFSGYRPPTLPINSNGCTSSLNTSSIFQNLTIASEGLKDCTTTSSPVASVKNDIFILYKISYLWIAFFGFLFTLCTIFLAILLTGTWNHNIIPANSKCLSPITKLWMKPSRPQESLVSLEEQVSLTNVNGFERTSDTDKI